MSPGEAQARGIGAQHHGSTRSWDRTQQTEREGGGTSGYVPGIGPVAPQHIPTTPKPPITTGDGGGDGRNINPYLRSGAT